MLGENKQSSLPHVLVEYNAELIPPGTPRSIKSVRYKSESPQYVVYERQKSKSSHKPRESPYRQQTPVSAQASSGSRSAGKKRARKTEEQREREAAIKRYEELSGKWDQAKREVRLEDHEQLLEKLVLQQELIRKQDEFADLKKKQQQEEQLQKKESERQKRQQLEEELQQKCKQSLEEDKKSQKEARKQKPGRGRKDGSPTSILTSTPSPTKSPTTPTTPGSKRGFPFKMTLPAMSATPDLLGDSDEEKEEMKIPQDAPWHEQQLYKLYGKQADYFIRPKMEVKEKVKKTNPKLRRQGGRAGAEVLWQTLRQDSSQRLLQEDANIPTELKAAYGSFARQSLKKTNAPVRRMFCSEEDLPEMPRLIDHRKLLQMRKMRHKFDLMYRASKSNEDRTEVLTFNNPLPEFNHGMESISNYLPSWQDDESESTQPEYLRWLYNTDKQREATIPEEQDAADHIDDQPKHVTQSMDEDLVYILARRKPVKQKQKYVFMSEKDMETKGEFSEKYKDEREYKDIPRPYKGDMPKSYSALGGMISASPDKSYSSLRHSAPLPTRDEMIRSYTSGWEPLSMTALVEYKKQVSTIGDGDFNMGRVKMWSSIPVI